MSDTNWQRRRDRVAELKARVRRPDPDEGVCQVVGCGRQATAATGKGLNHRFCRRHEDHHERHGSPYRGSYTATELNPHRRAAFDWLTAHEADPYVSAGILAIQGLYAGGGRRVEAFRLAGLSPKERARVAWARLREAKVDPRLPLAAWLAVEMLTATDPTAEKKAEFRRVQAAKVVHRMASGSHRRWEHERGDGTVRVQELHKYPASRGRVLWHLGEQVETAGELIIAHHLPALLAFKKEQDAAGRKAGRPYPGIVKGAPRKRARQGAA